MLRIERVGTADVWTIDRPEAKNALDRKTVEALLGALAHARTDSSLRAVVLTGAGGAFVSGGDLRELRDRNSRADAEEFAAAGAELCAGLEGLRVPVLAAIAGPALGGGAELAVACDLRVGDPTARIAFKQVRMGVTTAWGTMARLVTLVGASGAARLLYTAHDVTADTAMALGLLDAVSLPGEAVTFALAWAAEIAQGSPAAVADMKALVRAARTAGEVAGMERERFVATWTGPDHAEAMEAYFARRAPAWKPLA